MRITEEMVERAARVIDAEAFAAYSTAYRRKDQFAQLQLIGKLNQARETAREALKAAASVSANNQRED